MQITTGSIAGAPTVDCNRLSPKCKSQLIIMMLMMKKIVTDYRLNANHNKILSLFLLQMIVTDYRLNANHNHCKETYNSNIIVTDYRLNANHNG